MKTLSALIATYLQSRRMRSNLRIVRNLLLALAATVALYSVLFHYLMALEGRPHSWVTGFYWTMVTMSTLGFGDITFASDVGRVFSVLVLVTGTVFMLILLPFTFIQFFYAPWLEARDAARAPRELPADTTGHVILTGYSPVDSALIRRLEQFRTPYVVLAAEVSEALGLFDDGVRVMVGELDDPEAYRRARVEQAALVVATRADTTNTNVAFTVRECSPDVPIAATVSAAASVDILQLAGCQHVLQLGEMLGRFMARRVYTHDGRTHVVGQLGDLLIAEAAVAGTELAGRTLREAALRPRVGVTVAGVWDRGRFILGSADTVLTSNTVLLLAGAREQLSAYDADFGHDAPPPQFVIVIGGGRVGRAIAAGLSEQRIDHRIVEKVRGRVNEDERVVVGDAADLDVLKAAGIDRASAVAVTTHDDDVNVYLTLYCRRLRPDIQILSRSTLERNAATLRRAGADFVLSYASMGANAIFNILRHTSLMVLGEGLDVFTVPVPRGLAGRTLAGSGLRDMGVNVLAATRAGRTTINPDITTPLELKGLPRRSR